MRVLLISDSHGKNQNMEKVIRKLMDIDLLIHLGDLEGEEGYLEMITPCPIEMIAGNNDFFTALPREKIITLGRHRVWLIHGHQYYIASGYGALKDAARQKGCSYVLCGHTHYPYYESDHGVTVINPGSISKPRQDNKRPSYVILDIDRKGNIHSELCYL